VAGIAAERRPDRLGAAVCFAPIDGSLVDHDQAAQRQRTVVNPAVWSSGRHLGGELGEFVRPVAVVA